jgi:myosin heavy subunit
LAAALHLGNIELKNKTRLEGTCQQPPCTGHVQEAVLSVVAAVLHLGNVELAQNAEDEAVLASDEAEEELRIVAGLLQVSRDR